MTLRHIFVPDLQLPVTNRRQVRSLVQFIKAKKKRGEIHKVHQVGDAADLTQFGRWVRNQRGEYDQDIRKHLDDVTRVLASLQVDHWKAGNHEARAWKYVEDNAPALSPLTRNRDILSVESLYRLDDIGVRFERGIYEFAPNAVVAHGDEGPISNIAGQTALKLATRIGKSVVCGHTHRAGLSFQTESFNGIPARTLFGLEAGNFMNLADAGYMRGGYANWQSAFGVVDVDNLRVQPYVVLMSQTGSFSFEGESWDDTGLRAKAKGSK